MVSRPGGRIELEEQHILAVETQIDRLQILERADEESGARRAHQKRDRDLAHDEQMDSG